MADDALVDLRSDTVTRPTPQMRRAMADAAVGDDVYGEDPTVRRLEEMAAERVGREAALFVPSGTMGNQIAIHLHAPPGTDVLVEAGSHVYNYELGAMAAWTGALPRVLWGERGHLDPEQLPRAVSPPVYYLGRTSLLVLENTHNHAGGTVLPRDRARELTRRAHELGLRVHLDGARIFNAAVAAGRSPSEMAAGADSIMFCLSKGLGAPVGSLLCGDREWIERARVVRKRLGGGMRQAGILAAAGVVALERHVDRLAEDHRRAAELARAAAELPGLRLDPAAVDTNIVIAEVRAPARTDRILSELRARGVLAGAMGPGRIRFVTHLDVTDSDVERAIRALREAVGA